MPARVLERSVGERTPRPRAGDSAVRSCRRAHDWAAQGPADRTNLAFEADGLVVAGWRTNVAQRKPVFYQGCPSPAVSSTEHEGEFADRAIEGLRVQVIDSDRHPCHTHMARLGQRALPDGLERPGESARPPYVMDRSSSPGRSCDACGNSEGDVPPLPLQAERISLGTPPVPIPQEWRVYGIFRTR